MEMGGGRVRERKRRGGEGRREEKRGREREVLYC